MKNQKSLVLHCLNIVHTAMNNMDKDIFDVVRLRCHHVVIQFLSGVVPLAETTRFTPFLLQLLALHPSTCLVSGILFLQTNLLCLFFHLLLPGLPWSSSLSLATHLEIQSNPQNTIVIHPQHMSIPSNSSCCC